MQSDATFLWGSATSNPAAFSALAAVVSAIVALTATILTPLVSFWITRQQIRATLVSANRQAWINALRDDLSELFEHLEWLFALTYDSRRGSTVGEERYKYREERRSRIRLLINRIRLRINQGEKPSATLLSLIWKLHSLALQPGDDEGEEFNDTMESAVSKSQEILKAEWKQVKKGR
jgi:hypothetical protein